VGGSTEPLSCLLTDQVEVSITIGDSVVDQSSRRRVSHAFFKLVTIIEFSVNSFVHAEEYKFCPGTNLL